MAFSRVDRTRNTGSAPTSGCPLLRHSARKDVVGCTLLLREAKQQAASSQTPALLLIGGHRLLVNEALASLCRQDMAPAESQRFNANRDLGDEVHVELHDLDSFDIEFQDAVDCLQGVATHTEVLGYEPQGTQANARRILVVALPRHGDTRANMSYLLPFLRMVLLSELPIATLPIRLLHDQVSANAAKSAAALEGFCKLPPSLRRVVPGLAKAQTNGQIAAELNLSENTVRSYISEILRQLGYRTRYEAAVFSVISGFCPPPTPESSRPPPRSNT